MGRLMCHILLCLHVEVRTPKKICFRRSQFSAQFSAHPAMGRAFARLLVGAAVFVGGQSLVAF